MKNIVINMVNIMVDFLGYNKSDSQGIAVVAETVKNFADNAVLLQ